MAAEQTETRHPTHRRRRKVKGPPSTLPQVPLSALQHRLDTSSDDPDEERDVGQGHKTLRSTSTIPRSDSVRAWAPHGYDNVMGVSSLSERKTDSEKIRSRGKIGN